MFTIIPFSTYHKVSIEVEVQDLAYLKIKKELDTGN